MEKVNEHCFLFGIEGGIDFQCPFVQVSGVEGYELDVFRGLKVTGMAFEVGDLFGQIVEVCHQGCRLQDGFSMLDALYVALVGVFIGGPDSDDTLGARHFELEVGIVGNRHEFGVAGVPKNGVVGPMEPNHLESEGLLPEVGEGTETDRQVDPPDGLCSSSRHNSMEAPDAGSKVRPLDS
jgi:hypothetical protein